MMQYWGSSFNFPAPASNLWTPAGGSLWLDMFSSANYTDVGGFASQVNDLSGNNRNAIQGTAANRAAIVTASGYTALRFDGTNDEMIINSQFFPSGAATSASYIIAAVAKVNTNKFGGIITTNPSGTNSGCGLLLDNVGKFVNNFSGGQTVSTTVGGARNIIVAVVNAGVRTIWINGTQEGSATVSSGNITQSTRVVMGKYRDETGNNGAFDLEALSVFVGTASTTIRQNLEGFFANNRGLTGGLPAGHPWKSTPPTL